MKKKLMAVAVAGALAAPALALAQTSTVNIYGNIVVDYVYLDQGSNSTPNTRVKKLDLLSRYDSYLGFRGEEKLGGGLSAWFQCENTMDVTGEDQSIGGGPTGLCDRNSGVGFRGVFGNVFVGNWDSPFKLNSGGKYRPFSSAGIYGFRSLLHNENDGDPENSPHQFNRRNINTVNWHSPSWGGFNVKGQYSALDIATNNTNGGGVVRPFKPRLYALGAEYDNGPLAIAVSYEAHKDFNPGVVSVGPGIGSYSGGTDRAWQIAAGYTFARVFRLSGIFTEIRYDVANGFNMKNRGWAIYGDWNIAGPHRLRMMYANARDTQGNADTGLTGDSSIGSFAYPMSGGVRVSDTGADLWGIQYAYHFSKRTELNIGMAHLDNDRNARHRLQTSAARPGGSDRDQTGYQVGIKHRF